MQKNKNRVFQLEGTYNDHRVQLPDSLRADQKLKHVVKGIVQMSLKQSQVRGIDHLSRKPVAVFDHLLSKEMFPNVQSRFPLALHCTIPMHPLSGYQGEELSTSLSTSIPQEAVESNEVTPQPALLQNSYAQSP